MLVLVVREYRHASNMDKRDGSRSGVGVKKFKKSRKRCLKLNGSDNTRAGSLALFPCDTSGLSPPKKARFVKPFLLYRFVDSISTAVGPKPGLPEGHFGAALRGGELSRAERSFLFSPKEMGAESQKTQDKNSLLLVGAQTLPLKVLNKSRLGFEMTFGQDNVQVLLTHPIEPRGFLGYLG